jgi:hypothetical protein
MLTVGFGSVTKHYRPIDLFHCSTPETEITSTSVAVFYPWQLLPKVEFSAPTSCPRLRPILMADGQLHK